VDTVCEPQAVRTPTILPGHEAWFRWVRAHAKPGRDWVKEGIGLAFIDPIPPPTPVPAWVLRDLLPGQRLLLRGGRISKDARPRFRVITSSGRDLGGITRIPAEMIQFLLDEGIEPHVCVLVSNPGLPPQDALQLDLEIEAWFAPGEPVTMPLVFDEREEP
jgi:hypothetical protein